MSEHPSDGPGQRPLHERPAAPQGLGSAAAAEGSRNPEVEAFWVDARVCAGLNPASGYFGPGSSELLTPPAWSFGATREQAQELLDLVLSGRKHATSSALWDYEAEGEPLPKAGDLSIVLDGHGHPRALIVTTAVRVAPFDEVDEAHAAAEGEGDLSLQYWREVHETFFRAGGAVHGRGFSLQMPVVLEQFDVLVPTDTDRRG